MIGLCTCIITLDKKPENPGGLLKFAGKTSGVIHLILCLLFSSTLLVACVSKSTLPSPSPTTLLPTATTNSIRLANGEWPPYSGSNLPHGGCDSWVVEEAFALEDIKVEYEFFPWARGYNLSTTGVFDGTVDWADTPDHRETHYISAEPTTIQEMVFFYRSDPPFTYTSLDDLEGKTIGLTSGYVYNDAFKELKETDTVTFIDSASDEDNFRMLLAGRIDLFPIERKVGYYILSEIFTTEETALITAAKKPIYEFKAYLLLSKAIQGNENRMKDFDQGFQELVESGHYKEIIDQCGK
jgi:polar amino acid transport system substrate-binding protein